MLPTNEFCLVPKSLVNQILLLNNNHVQSSKPDQISELNTLIPVLRRFYGFEPRVIALGDLPLHSPKKVEEISPPPPQPPQSPSDRPDQPKKRNHLSLVK